MAIGAITGGFNSPNAGLSEPLTITAVALTNGASGNASGNYTVNTMSTPIIVPNAVISPYTITVTRSDGEYQSLRHHAECNV